MFEIINQLETNAQRLEDEARDAGRMMFEYDETVEWRAAQLLRALFAAHNDMIDNTTFVDDGVKMSFRTYAQFLERINRLTYGEH